MKTRGVEISSGSLGNGLSVASGIAAAAKIDGKKNRIFCLMGDGECDEGLIWEAAMLAPHKKLNNLTAIVDRNMLQIDGCTEDVICLEPFSDKWRAFNWNVIECDGHSYPELLNAFKEADEAKRSAISDHREDSQGQRRQLYGEQRRLPRKSTKRH